MTEQKNTASRIGDNRGPPIEDPGLAQDYQLVGPLALHSEAVDPEELIQFLAAIRSQGNNPVRQAAISNTLRRARADPHVSHVQYRLLEQTASRTRQVGRYNYEPQEVRGFFSSLRSGTNVGRFEAPMVLLGYMRTIRFARKSGGRPMVFSTIQCTAADRTGESHGELMGKARHQFNGEERALRAGYNWSAETDDLAAPARHLGDFTNRSSYELEGIANRSGYDLLAEKQGSRRNGYDLPNRSGYELIVNNTTPVGASQDDVDAPPDVPTEHQIQAVRSLSDTFGKRPGSMVIQPTSRDAIELDLRTTVKPITEKYGLQIAREALDHALVLARQSNRTSKGEGGAPALFRYLFRTLPGVAADIEVADIARTAKQQTERGIQTELAEKRIRGIQSRGGRVSRETDQDRLDRIAMGDEEHARYKAQRGGGHA